MFQVGDYVINRKTLRVGQVIGYGHQIVDNVYETTLKVLIAQADNFDKRGFVEEDLYSVWVQWLNA